MLGKMNDNGLTFTIQNVPIKLVQYCKKDNIFSYLQYKMFLLNRKFIWINKNSRLIYNTKCSY